MKKIFLLTALITLGLSLFAQEIVNQTQVGLVFNNFDNFGLSFKKGFNKFMWRYNLMSIDGNKTYDITDTTSQTKFGISLAIGNEFKKKITDNFEFCFGYDFSYSYSQVKNTDDNSTSKSYTKTSYKVPGVNLVFGLNCIIKDHFVIGAELLPFYSRIKQTDFKGTKNDGSEVEISEKKDYSYGLSSSSVRVSLAYRF
jgi:hypothetical protein